MLREALEVGLKRRVLGVQILADETPNPEGGLFERKVADGYVPADANGTVQVQSAVLTCQLW